MAALAPATTVRQHQGVDTGNGAAWCDVVFLAHPPGTLSLLTLLSSRDKRPLRRWEASPWMYLVWPFTFLFSVWDMFVLPLLFGPYKSYGRFQYKGAVCRQWLTRACGYQFMIKRLRPRIARGIEAAVRKADEAGVSVLGLGALNKAEWINGGGQDVLKALEPLKLRLVHGNTLTAAVVIENIKAANKAMAGAACVFLTGATSKIGRATALTLALEGYEVVCCTTSGERFASLEEELALIQQQQEGLDHSTAGVGTLSRAKSVEEGARFKLWAVGKYDTSVRKHIPQMASAVVFSVPCPLEGYRPDVSKIDGGILRMDMSSSTPRGQHMLLPFDQVYACHAASLVHHLKGWTHHETGKIDINRIDATLHAAEECGFSVPSLSSPDDGNAVVDEV